MLLRSPPWDLFWILQDCIQIALRTCLLHTMVGYIQLQHKSVWLHECILFLGLSVYQQWVTSHCILFTKTMNLCQNWMPTIHSCTGAGWINCYLNSAPFYFKFASNNGIISRFAPWNLTTGGNNGWFWLFGVVNNSARDSWESNGRTQSLRNLALANSSFQYGCPKDIQYRHQNSQNKCILFPSLECCYLKVQ